MDGERSCDHDVDPEFVADPFIGSGLADNVDLNDAGALIDLMDD